MVMTTAETIGEERLKKYWIGVKEVLTMKDLQRELEVLTMKDLQRALEVLREKLVVLESRIKEEQNNDDEWPKNGDRYWCEIYSDGGIFQTTWTGHPADFHRKATGNCFRAKEEAVFYLERLKVMAELERLSDNDGKKFMDVWTIDEDGANCFPICNVNSVSTPYIFTNRIKALEAIKKIGEERLRKYWFGVKEVL